MPTIDPTLPALHEEVDRLSAAGRPVVPAREKNPKQHCGLPPHFCHVKVEPTQERRLQTVPIRAGGIRMISAAALGIVRG
jgi:hypothetical protein